MKPFDFLFHFQFISSGRDTNKGVMIKYLKAQRSQITADDVTWVIDEQVGWSTCSETCAGGNTKNGVISVLVSLILKRFFILYTQVYRMAF